ncbi:hypothetical protein JW960_23175 [candidate division KSB1 bacterium]|nr:hypothetical protein [candidate division KSB1 bacterium]
MNVPPATDVRWKDVITGKVNYQFEFFAFNMCVKRLSLVLKRDSSQITLNKCTQELRDIFAENVQLPKVQRDLVKIFGKGGVA